MIVAEQGDLTLYFPSVSAAACHLAMGPNVPTYYSAIRRCLKSGRPYKGYIFYEGYHRRGSGGLFHGNMWWPNVETLARHLNVKGSAITRCMRHGFLLKGKSVRGGST